MQSSTPLAEHTNRLFHAWPDDINKHYRLLPLSFMHFRTLCSQYFLHSAHQTKLINPLISLCSKALYAYMKIGWKNINNSSPCHAWREGGKSQTAHNPPTGIPKNQSIIFFLTLFRLYIIRKIWWYPDFFSLSVSCPHRIEWHCHEVSLLAGARRRKCWNSR